MDFCSFDRWDNCITAHKEETAKGQLHVVSRVRVKRSTMAAAARIGNGSGNLSGNGNGNGINNGRKTRRANQKLIKIMSASAAACDSRGLRRRKRDRQIAGARSKRDRESEWRAEREKTKPNNNIYVYFYEVLTNFYEFLMGPLQLCVSFLCYCYCCKCERDRQSERERAGECVTARAQIPLGNVRPSPSHSLWQRRPAYRYTRYSHVDNKY